MIIASRILKLKGVEAEIPIRVFAPERSEVDWICRFEIEWPETTLARFAAGVDAVQALLLALQMIGSQIYASNYHTSGQLMWLEPNQGYGFPVPNTLRDMLIGDDARYGS
jgi:hypothetical protein